MFIYDTLIDMFGGDTVDVDLFLKRVYPNNSINNLSLVDRCKILDMSYNGYTDLFLDDIKGYEQLYNVFTLTKTPQKIAFEYFGSEFDCGFMKREIERIGNKPKIYNYSDIFTWLNTDIFTKDKHGHLPDNNICYNVDHFDFTQLYPHIALKCSVGETKYRLNNFITKSIEMKKNKDVKRPLIKLMLNSYWGYVSCGNLTFKRYMLFTENELLERSVECFDYPLMVKTDGVYGVGMNSDKLRNVTDIPFDDEYNLIMFVLNTGNYCCLSDDYKRCTLTGMRFRNGISKLPFSTYNFLPITKFTTGSYRNGRWMNHNYDDHLEGKIKSYLERG